MGQHNKKKKYKAEVAKKERTERQEERIDLLKKVEGGGDPVAGDGACIEGFCILKFPLISLLNFPTKYS